MGTVQGRSTDFLFRWPIAPSMSVVELSLNKERYVEVLEKLIGETEFLQDSPPKFVPQEDRLTVLNNTHKYILPGSTKNLIVTFISDLDLC